MTDEQRIAFLHAALMRANIRAIAMQSENIQRVQRGEAIAYGEQAFLALINEEGIHDNAVRRLLIP